MCSTLTSTAHLWISFVYCKDTTIFYMIKQKSCFIICDKKKSSTLTSTASRKD